MSSEGSMEQTRDLTYRNRIGGQADRASRLETMKPISIKGPQGKSGRRAGKAVKLTSGDLQRVRNAGLRGPRGFLTAVQKSAAGVVPAARQGRPKRSSRKGVNGKASTTRDS